MSTLQTPEQVAPNIYRLEVPLAGNPLRAIYPYLIRGGHGGRNLLVDTAFNTDECEASLRGQLAALGADLDRTDLFITHLHVDHAGLVGRLKTPGNTVYAGPVDGPIIAAASDERSRRWFAWINTMSGRPEEETRGLEERHVIFARKSTKAVDVTMKAPGEYLTYGGYTLEVVDLGGHTPGQVGLWHAPTGMLISGDHILAGITPHLSAWDLEYDYVALFCGRLRFVRTLPVALLLPSHGTAVTAVNERIDEMLEHHRLRLDAIEEAVRAAGSPVNAWQVASAITWARGRTYDTFPDDARWFACSEALAHLQSLVFAGRLRARIQDGGVAYFP
jgi:glyoxylase-like metal-dependent hydrolase (beta-lactamase superfamily II)